MAAYSSYVKPTESIEFVHLLRRLQIHDRSYVRFFLITYALLPVLSLVLRRKSILIGAAILSKDLTIYAFLILLGIIHLLSILLPIWSTAFAVRLQYKYVDDIKECTHIYISICKNIAPSMILPLEIAPKVNIFDSCSYFTNGSDTSYQNADKKIRKFSFRNREWTWDHRQKLFTMPFFPDQLSFEKYMSWKGHDDKKDIRLALSSIYGKNRFSIDIPKFSSLFAEHAVAPFFVFQMICVLLWCLDEYWMYSLFSGVMFVIFEAISVVQIRSNMSMMLKMGKIPVSMNQCWLNGKWKEVTSDTLLPGDIIRIPSDQYEFLIPCDMLIVKGTMLVNEALLTGESTPQVKQSIAKRNPSNNLDFKTDHHHVLYGGTKVLSVYPEEVSNESIAFVLRTGFSTEQGKLLTSIIHSSDRLAVQDRETMFFILFLLFFAFLACVHVINRGWGVESRDQWKLVLTCIRILTSVVPPELPMELSMAINNSLNQLTQMQIYCTQPHRIPLAGKIDVCCFDKTGTLTCDAMVLNGVTDYIGSFHPVKDKSSLRHEHWNIMCVLAACNSVLCVGDEKAGDPMEKAAMDAVGWDVKSNSLVTEKSGKRSISILTRFAFDTSLKRMSVIAGERQRSQRCVLLKGAPEVVETLLVSVPINYTETYHSFARRGYRVLALARKEISPDINDLDVARWSREKAESSLEFLGFAIFESQVKADCKTTISDLKRSRHIPMMITGDNDLTAIAVAKSIGILATDDSPLILRQNQDGLCWENLDGHVIDSFASEKPPETENVLCVNGDAYELAVRVHPLWMRNITPAVRVWARCTPETKSNIVLCLKDLGKNTLFAGDGINDMAALKHADVGISVLNSPNPHEIVSIEQNFDFLKDNLRQIPIPVYQKEIEEVSPENGFLSRIRIVIAQKQREIEIIDRNEIMRVNRLRKQGKPTRLSHSTALRLKMKLSKGLGEGDELFEASTGAPLVHLGDASIASPFTSKTSKVSAVLDVLRMGRCSLATTLQMYRIIALNCLTGAYTMSVLYSDGVKLGDYQMVVVSALITICFLWISRSKPLCDLSSKRPSSRIFCPYIISTILVQFTIHLIVFIGSVWLVDSVDYSARVLQGTPTEVENESFKPTLLNSVIFLAYTMMTVTTFAVNYQGEPFMTPLRSNTVLRNGLIILTALISVISLEIFPAFNLLMEIVPFPGFIFRVKLISLLFFDLLGPFLADRLLVRVLE